MYTVQEITFLNKYKEISICIIWSVKNGKISFFLAVMIRNVKISYQMYYKRDEYMDFVNLFT